MTIIIVIINIISFFLHPPPPLFFEPGVKTRLVLHWFVFCSFVDMLEEGRERGHTRTHASQEDSEATSWTKEVASRRAARAWA